MSSIMIINNKIRYILNSIHKFIFRYMACVFMCMFINRNYEKKIIVSISRPKHCFFFVSVEILSSSSLLSRHYDYAFLFHHSFF